MTNYVYILITDASSSNEAVHLQQRLRSLSSELVTLRNRLHVQNPPQTTVTSPTSQNNPTSPTSVQTVTATANVPISGTQNNNSTPISAVSTQIQPAVPPRQTHHSTITQHNNHPPTCKNTTPVIQTELPKQNCTENNNKNHNNNNNNVGVNADLEDLIHLPGPLTEDAVMKCLHARFNNNEFYVSIFPIT